MGSDLEPQHVNVLYETKNLPRTLKKEIQKLIGRHFSPLFPPTFHSTTCSLSYVVHITSRLTHTFAPCFGQLYNHSCNEKGVLSQHHKWNALELDVLHLISTGFWKARTQPEYFKMSLFTKDYNTLENRHQNGW